MRKCWLLSAALSAAACGEDTAMVLADDTDAVDVAVGERRTLDVRFMRLDVEGYVEENTLKDLRAMPRSVLQSVWLLDLDIRPLLNNALAQLKTLSPDEVDALPVASRNMHTLLSMTPDNANLEGTNMEELLGLSGAVGIPPAKALADLLNVGVSDDFIPVEAVAQAMLTNVVATHPSAQFRHGLVDDEHPDGLYPVTPNTIPVTLLDVVTNFDDMAERFGPVDEHPGFVLDAHGVTVIEDEFKMLSKVNANALPYKGVDLTNASVASVNSTSSQIQTLHDFADPQWLEIRGLAVDPRIDTLTFGMRENDAYIPGGTSREPAGQGDSPAWDLPPWEFEHLIAEMARVASESIPTHCDTYSLATGVDAFTACIADDGWVTLETFNNSGSPPDPAYLWDLDLEIAQTRLHDGGLAEGAADVSLTVHDVAVGIDPESMSAQARENIRDNPEALREFAALIADNTVGDADFYYYQSDSGEDWLYFIADYDIGRDEDGAPVRGYDYASPGFFADSGLSNKVSSTQSVDGDTDHEKIRVIPGDTVYIGDDDGRVFEIYIGEKTKRSSLSLEITRSQ